MTAATAPAAFVGGGAVGGGMAAAARFGAVQGAKVAFLSSSATNVDEARRGAKTTGEAIADTALDTGKGAAFGAVAGVAASKIGSGLGRLKGRFTEAPKSAPKGGPSAEANSGRAWAERARAGWERSGWKKDAGAWERPRQAPEGGTKASAEGPRAKPETKTNTQAESAHARGAEGPKDGPDVRQNPRGKAAKAAEKTAEGGGALDKLNPDKLDDAYKILGVEKGEEKGTIDIAYRQAALKYHPDRNTGNTDYMTKVNNARDKIYKHNQWK